MARMERYTHEGHVTEVRYLDMLSEADASTILVDQLDEVVAYDGHVHFEKLSSRVLWCGINGMRMVISIKYGKLLWQIEPDDAELVVDAKTPGG